MSLDTKILSNPAAYGRYVPRGKLAGGSDATAEAPIDGYFPAIIDEATFWSAQAASKSRGFGKGTPGRRKNLLSKLVRCEACSNNLVLLDKTVRGGGHKLKCGRAHASAGCDHRTMYDCKLVELAVMFGLGQRRKGLIAAATDRQGQAKAVLSAAQARRDDLERQLANLIQLVQASGGGSRLGKQVQALEAAVDAADDEIVALDRAFRQSQPTDVDSATEGLQAVYNRLNADPDDLAVRAAFQQRLKLLVDHVVLGPSGFVVTHTDGSTSRTSFAGPLR